MDGATLSRFPHLSWLGHWTAVGGSGATVVVHHRQVSHCLIYTSQSPADVRWIRRGQEKHFHVDAGTVRFSPADGDQHVLIGSCSPGHTFYKLLIPQRHVAYVARSEGVCPSPDWNHSVSANDPVLTSCMERVSCCSASCSDNSGRYLEEAARSLILQLVRKNAGGTPDWHDDASVFDSRTINHLVEHIDANLKIAPSVSDMGMRVSLSPSHFAKKFRQSTGLSLYRFINRRRIRASLEMLRNQSDSLASIALDLGFSSQSHFTRLFTYLTGMTPAKHRKSVRRTVA